MKSSLKNLYRKSLFNNSFMGFVFNPSFIVRSALYRILSSKAPLFDGLDVLDAGCGSKPYKDFFKNSKSYKGIDTHNSGHDHSQESIDIYYNGANMPLAGETYDAVVSFQVLEHVLDSDLFMSEIHRVLRRDGLVLMSIPFNWPEHEQPYDFRRFTSFGVTKLFKQHGFEIIDVKKTTNFPQTILQMTSVYVADFFKTRNPFLNLFIMAFFNPILNSLGIIARFSRNFDLFCDIVVTARKIQQGPRN